MEGGIGIGFHGQFPALMVVVLPPVQVKPERIEQEDRRVAQLRVGRVAELLLPGCLDALAGCILQGRPRTVAEVILFLQRLQGFRKGASLWIRHGHEVFGKVRMPTVVQQEGHQSVHARQELRPVGGKEQIPGFGIPLRQRGVQAFFLHQPAEIGGGRIAVEGRQVEA